MHSGTRRKPSGAAVLRPELTEAIVEIALGELAEKGYGRMSMEAVARRAGVGKSALYRRWPSKQALAVDAVARISVPLAETPDTGSLRGDVRAMLEALLSWLDDPRLGGILTDLMAEARRNGALARALAERVGEPRRARGEALLDRAAARGEVPAGLDREIVLDLIPGALFWHLGARRQPVTADYLDRLADTLVTALTAGRAGA
ncbi:TetR family transcriptional regulator [Streptomyces carminius]|uniref:TetR family transcriptional regulator n=1 Tax=Streptomyces carminius TaxID=2665496 RepID=A0A2M8LSZ5_9ACTN|nr:TetR/AcrR family transcriptional regulator [Streptomyces carminius]PJE95083.1 TetR family transcriptional regulator [Streptomyces carminius]